tara:strand:- start:6225 stop:15545 length:9321 start_codon:yes stop_codon:yes gene_type:complete
VANGQEQNFQPQIDAQQTRQYIKMYGESPHRFKPQDLEVLRLHAQYHNVPFYEGDFGIVDSIKQFAGGLIEGFTTFNVIDEPPDNEYEAIIRSIGHLAGFAPGFAAAPIRGLGALTKSRTLLRSARAIGGVKSVPLLGADFLTKRAKKIAKPILKNLPNSRFKAMSVASKFLLGNKAKHIMEGAFHLGAASSISTWQEGVDGMMHSFFGGAVAGGAFAGMGNLINVGNKKANVFARGLAGSLFQGLHSTARGATTPEQIYEYLLGAYFGGVAKPWFKVKANKNIQKMNEQAKKDPKMEIQRDPELLEGFAEQPEIVQKHTKELAKEIFGDSVENAGIAHMLMERLGITDKIPEEKLTTTGYEMLSKIKKKMKKKDGPAKIISIALGTGEKGLTEQFSKELERAGIPVINYKPGKSKRSRIGEDVELTEKELFEQQEAMNTANKTLRHSLKNIDESTMRLILRSIYQSNKGDAVFGIGEIERSNKDTKLNGRTIKDKNVKWGVQSAVDKKKPIYIFDTKSNVWHTFNYDPKIKRFEPIKEVPTLTKKPVILAGGKPNPNTKKAIKDIIKQSMGKVVKQTPPGKDEKRTSIADMPERHPETWNQLWDIAKRKKDLSEKLEKANTSKEIDRLTKEYDELVSEESLLLELRPTEYIDMETGVLMNDIDTGGKLDIPVLMKKSEYFVRTHLPHLWVKEDKPRESMLKSAKMVEEIISKYEDSGSKEIKSEQAVKDIETELNTTLKDTAKGEIRRWIRELNLSKPVSFIRVDSKGNVSLTDPNRPRTLSGKNKLEKEPVKEIEVVYEEQGGKYKKGAKSAYIVLDAVSIRDDRGIMIDVPIDKLAKYIQFNIKTKGKRVSKNSSELKARAIVAKVIKTMDKKHNMYPVGGVGDKSRIIFTKVHPKSRGSNMQILRDLVKIRRELRKIDPNHTQMFKKAKKDAFINYGIDEKTFNKLFHSNVMYDLSLNGFDLTQIDKIMGKGFIGNPIAYNKRAQIWYTPSLAADKVFIKDKIKDLDNGNFVYSLIGDPSKPKGKTSLEALNIELPEHVDGAILVRDDVVDVLNLDAGHPMSGQNKSFIIDKHGELGTMLGKYMIHKVGSEGTQQMKDQGVHMLIMTSAAKQTGLREIGDYNVSDKGFELKAPKYTMDPESIKYSGSTIQTPHMMKNQVWVKQLFTNLQQFGHKKIDKSIINNIEEEILDKSFKGTDKANKLLADYLTDFNEKKIPELLNSLEEISSQDLISALKTPGAERFAEGALQRMLKVVEENIESDYQSGYISLAEKQSMVNDLVDFISPVDRLIKNAAIVGEEASSKGKIGFSAYHHKHIRDYKNAVLHNYFVKSVTKPKVSNSMVARMRPYDKWMQRKFGDLNTRDDIFYLDEAYRAVEIETSFKEAHLKKTTLGVLWDMYSNNKFSGQRKKEVEEIFEAVVLRVPMDSISGAHKLKFKGFTGVDGHGIMMHSRSMRALGGADLDGDEAFVYFGGRSPDGKGGGMKKSWKDAIHAQKEEFYKGEGSKRDVGDNKRELMNHPEGKYKGKTFADVLTISAEGDNPLKTSKTLYYSPSARLEASQGAVDGRNRLGPAVNNGQIMKSVYNSLMDTPGKIDVFEIDFYNKKTKKNEKLVIEITPREGSDWNRYQREMTRAQIAFASDPLDEAGLVESGKFFTLLHDGYFKTKILNNKGKQVKRELSPFHLKNGLIGKFIDMNSAFFGRNWDANRRYTAEEVSELSSGVLDLLPQQVNTILPKMVRKLHGLDWSDNILKRINEKRVEDLFFEMEDISESFKWLQDIMGRESFRVPYNKYVQNIITYDLQDITKREQFAFDNALFSKAIKGTTWEKIIKNPKYAEYLANVDKKFEILTRLTRQAEDFILNDFTDMATLLNMKRILGQHKINGKRIGSIFRQAELFKARSYLNKRERDILDLEVYQGTSKEKEAQEAVALASRYRDYLLGKIDKYEKDLGKKGAERSATLDQAMLDVKIKEYRSKLKSTGEKDLFDQFMIGSLNRGDLAHVQKLIDKIPQKKWSPIMSDLVNKLVKEGSRTSLSRLAINSESIPDASIRNHLKALNDVMGKSWERPSNKDIESSINKTSKAADKSMVELADGTKVNQEQIEVMEMESLVNDVLGNQRGYIGIKKADLRRADKELITELAQRLQKYNNKLGNNLNEVLRGLMETATGRGKDLNAFNRQDFQIVNNLLREYESGTMFQRFWRDSSPDLKKRYTMLFPETVAREQMKYDILWLKKEGYYIDKSGKPKKGIVAKPTHYVEVLSNWISKTNNLATGEAERMIVENGEIFLNLNSLREGDALFKIANAQREGKFADIIANDKTRPFSTRKNDANTYRIHQRNTEKEFEWDKLKDKEFTITNDNGEKITATGFEIVNGSQPKNLKGVKDKITEQFRNFKVLINGTQRPEDTKYWAGDWYDRYQTQPRMNWKKFIADMETAYNKGEKPGMELGIDGMRHIARSMMVDLAHKSRKKEFQDIIIDKTGHIDSDMYFPHMFFSTKDATKALRRAIKSIKEDPNLSDKIDKKTGMSERQKELNNVAFRHKVLTGDWEFQDMQDWDRVDQLDYKSTLESVAKKKREKGEQVQWVTSNKKMGSMFSRKGHIPGWANDITVMNAYIRNVTGAYYRQVNQIMSRNVMNEAWKGQVKKFGPEVAARWQNWYKLYVQGAMGNPDVIPEDIMIDSGMKLKGTPFAWWADNKVLKRINGIKESLGLGKGDLPKELREFTYNDIRLWSNLEAKFELASLLAHPKSAVNNIFGGSMHTIESVGFKAWRNARDISYLRKINPEWKTKEDVMRFVIEKGVLPEFLVHELGLGAKVNRTKITSFVGDLTNKLIGNKEVNKSDILTLGKKHGLTDAIVDKAAMFMTIPERALRRDAFMAHYIRAWERFGGAIKDPNHPFLIEMGLKGVKATQFLYDAPNRPLFARTALGKIMTRFQLWSWNSVKFRNDVRREARIHGYKPGTEAYERFKRTMQMDLFVLALGNIFMYSLFEQALPAPWNWFQDTSEWLFGDEEARDKAFFGNLPGAIAPLQIITPPISRFPITGLSQWIRNDYDKFTDYTMYTLLPFGRIVRDVVHPEKGLINNPLMVMEKTMGLPLLQLAKYAKDRDE